MHWSPKSLKLWHQHAHDAQIQNISKVSHDQIRYIKARFLTVFGHPEHVDATISGFWYSIAPKTVTKFKNSLYLNFSMSKKAKK